MEENNNIDQTLQQDPQADEESLLSIKNIMRMVVLHWKWFALSLVLCLGVATLYLRYKSAVYQVAAKMLIKDEESPRSSRGNQMLANMSDLGFISNSAGIDNEVEILQSHIIAREAVRRLKLYTTYHVTGRVKNQLIYKTQPVNVDIDPLHLNLMDDSLFMVKMSISKEGKQYNVEGMIIDSYNEEHPFQSHFSTMPASFTTAFGTFTFTRNPRFEWPEGRNLLVTIAPPTSVAGHYVGAMNVAPTSKTTSIALITLSDLSPARATDYLRELANVYNSQANADKNEIANKTERFINERLEKISNELGMTEGELESYKRQHNLTQLRLDATKMLDQSSQYTDKLSDANTQIMLLDFLREHVESANNLYQIIPSNVGLNDPITSSLIAEFNKTVQERERMLRTASENAPQVQTITSTLDQLRTSIRNALQQARHSADIQRQSIQSQYSVYNQKISSTPEQERVLTQIGRQQEVMSGLYLMLLQKREENSISLAATADKGKLIDDPIYKGKVSPKGSLIMMIALVLGLAIPFAIFYLLQLLRYKIEGREDVARLSKLPIVAEVPVASEKVKNAAGIVVKENTNNQIDEVFRALRTNVLFMLKGNQKVIMFTSSVSGEGKTFCAANLGASLALLGKKVVLVGLDIRKPALGKLFGLHEKEKGVTPLLVKDSVTGADVRSQVISSGYHHNLDLLLAGPIPPNPAELLGRDNLSQIVNELREIYDYVLLDTAPVGLVIDTVQIGLQADVCCYVCRADFTPKSDLQIVNDLTAEKKLHNVCLVVNGIDLSKKKYGYHYGYGNYGGYGRYGHYGDSNYGNKDDDSVKR